MKSSKLIIFCALLTTGFISCIDDESELGEKAIPELTIAGDSEKMEVLNFNLGTDCVIRPDITYKGASEENLTYTWRIGTYTPATTYDPAYKGELGEVVSNERDLTYFFTEGGSYYAHLVVTDGLVGQAMDYRININRTFEEGYVLVSTDENDNGNVAFVKIMTPEEVSAGIEQVYMEHCIERMNDGVSEKGLRNVVLGTITWPSTISRIIAATDEKCYFLDPNRFTIISEIDYTSVHPGFKATHFVYDDYSPYAYDANLKKYVHLEMQYMFGHENNNYKGMAFDDFVLSSYLAFGRAAQRVLFVNYNPASVAQYDAYAPYYGLDTYFPSTNEMLADEELLATFMGEEQNPSDYTTPMYILSCSKSNPNLLSLYTYTPSQEVPYISPGNNISKQECLLTDDMAKPAQGTRFVSSPSYHRFFYSVDNNVYVFLPQNTFTLPKKSNAAISFPANEVVTFMSVNIPTEELYVATYDTTVGRGNFYIYDTGDVRADNQTSPAPKASHKNCADKIIGILYKPSIQ